MRISLVLSCCCALAVVAAAGTAFGQIWPGYYGNGYGYGYGGWGATSQYNTTRNIEAADQLSGQVIAAQQSAAMQNNIRNTMMTQAQSQTQNILNQRQSNKDWWFQVQQQQAAQRRATPSRMPPLAAPATSFEPAPVAAAPSAPVTTAAAAPADEVMQWPVALQDPRFAGLRAEIEAPYRRTPGKMSYPTREEYLAMLQPIEQMRALLGQMTGELTAREYLDAEKFLNLVAQQAQERAKPKS